MKPNLANELLRPVRILPRRALQGMNWYGPLLAAILAAWMFGEEYRRNL